MKVEFEKETDGRWIAEVPKLPGVMAYGKTKQEAQRKVLAIALRTLAEVGPRMLARIAKHTGLTPEDL